MELPEDLKLLESNRPDDVEQAKQRFHEYLNNSKEAGLLNGIIEYFVNTGSVRCADVIACVREPHDTHFFNKITDLLRNWPAQRLNILSALSHVVYRHPPWLYRITTHGLFKDILKILKSEKDIIVLISALLILIVLLPMIPAYVGSSIQDIFDVFSHLAAWNTHNTNKLSEDVLVHLQVSLNVLFHRLYGMFPCHFLYFLRQQYGLRENQLIFSHTIKPMLETVKMHPLLVIASKETETTTTRWKSMELHDVLSECARLSVDVKDDTIPSTAMPTFRPRSESELRRIMEMCKYPDLKTNPNDMVEHVDLWAHYDCTSMTSPLHTPIETTAPSSIPLTPQTYVASSTQSHEIGTSPPEAAIEATPETTPVKDPRQYTFNRTPPIGSNVVRALNTLGASKWSSSSSTPTTSQPSSPMKKEVSPFRFPETSSDNLVHRKISTVLKDRQSMPSSKGRNSVNGVKTEESTESSQDDQEDQEVLTISREGEMRMSSSDSRSSRQCDSVLQDHRAQIEDLETGEQDAGQQEGEQSQTMPQPYNHMFKALLPPEGPEPESESEPQAPHRRDSPTSVLDRYLERASLQWNEDYTVKRSPSESDLKMARDQLVLLHMQLKFERHMRQTHDQRNRRLLGKLRLNRILEEHNSALRDQLRILTRDIDNLRIGIGKNRDKFMKRERALQTDIAHWQDKCTNLDKLNRELKAENEKLGYDLGQANQLAADTAKILQQVETQLFSVGNELKEATAQASAGEALKSQFNCLHKELVILGEQYARTHEVIGRLALRGGNELQMCKTSYHEEVRSLSACLDSKTSVCEELRTKVAELESALTRKDVYITEQKRLLRAVKEEFREELDAVETKYNSQVATNRKLESCILDLTSRLDKATRRSRRNVSAAQDVLSLAERGGMNSPLSLSLSSSEGFSQSSFPAAYDMAPIRDLQSVFDTPEVSRIPEVVEFDDKPGPSSAHD